ncbi:cadherin-related family member 1-like [Sinocyclocheilus anshuiensis]|uniref:cadherin-related family member 1-like n=1 Tax=Sinocyclocheilus anshuiensis TaxID=1608454 RepID=UPI0007B977E5|nr:PREDICTED: cadherin-related family member 1-like [Sinocyclocheilus anshuiensis]
MKSMRKKQTLILLISLCMSMGQSDFAPYFYDNGAGSSNGNLGLFSISEDTSVGTHVYTLNGSDPEGEPVTYGMTFDKGSKDYFSVEPKSGNVTLIQTLDREVQDEIVAFVTITDGRNKVVENVRVFITDANDEKPEFLNLPLVVDVPEDTASGSSIYRVQAVDRDLGSGGSVTYYLQSTPSTKFTIDGHSGALRIRSGESLDYEVSRTHFVTVVAKDGGGKYHGKYQVMTSTAIITINVLDTQDSPPVFVATPYFGFVYEVSVPGSEIFTVSAKDGDQNNPNTMHYSILSGSDGFFSINSTSGCISLTSFPVQLRNELYELQVKAAEFGADRFSDYSVTTVTVRVVDLNNHPPAFYDENGPQNRFELSMYEHPPEGEILRGLKITVNDSDQGANAKFRLLLVGPSRVLRVVPQTVLNEAQVTIMVENSSAIDYEKYQFLTFKLLAVEIDTLELFSATADIVINLLEKLLNNILTDGAIVNIMIFLVCFQAVDEDAEEPNNLIEYSIMKADPDNIFDINTSTGEIKLKPYIKSMEIVQNITKQKDCRWSVVVQARDRGSPSFSTTAVVKIDITEANGLKGPMAAFLMQSRDNPMKALGLAVSIITVIVLVTVIISTIMYFRNTKSNRITPARRIIRRRPKEPHRWTFRPWFGRSDLSFGKFFTDDETRDNTNHSSPRAKPPAPSAPVLPPPPPSERLRSVPTVSGSLASRNTSRSSSWRTSKSTDGAQRSGQNKDGSGISSALVSELKMRIEQKINEANQGYYH